MFATIQQVVVNGLLAGIVYVLIAMGFTLIFGIMRVVNFAHGALYMIGAAFVFFFYGGMGLNYFVAVLLAACLTGLLGAAIERFLFRPFVVGEMSGMIMSLGIAISLQSGALIVLGPADNTVPRPVSGIWRIGEVVIPLDRVLVGACAVVIVLLFYLMLKHTKVGLAMQAVAQDREAAALMGVRPATVSAAAFTMASVLAALAGGLMAPIYTINPYMGDLPMLNAFVVVILGGLGSIPGAVVGGLLIGLVESAFATSFDSTIALIASFGIVILVVLARPSGLLGKASA